MSERVRQTECPGVVDFFDRESGRSEVILYKDVDPVQVTLREDQNGVIEVGCPYYRDRECTRYEDISDFQGMGGHCRYTPVAEYKSPGVFEPAFESPSFYQNYWDKLSPQAKTLAVLMSPDAFAGLDKEDFAILCSHSRIENDPTEIIDELAELGVIEEWSKVGAMREALRLIDEGNIECKEVREGERQPLEAYKAGLQEELVEYFNPSPDRFNTLREFLTEEELEPIIERETKGWEIHGTHIRFAPGFQAFVEQFNNMYGLPINFTRPLESGSNVDEESSRAEESYTQLTFTEVGDKPVRVNKEGEWTTRARKEGLIQPYANPGTPKRVRAVVAFYDGEFKNFNQMLGIVGDSYLSRHEAGEFYRADGTYLGYLEPDPEQLAEWNKEVEYARAGEAEVRKHQERYVNRLSAWDLEEWRKNNKIIFQGISEDYDPSVATYNSTFIADLMRDTDGDESGEM